MMIFTVLLILHIIGGCISLSLGLYILITRKGNKIHRILGLIYFYSMLISSLISLPMAIMHPNYFLFIIGIFTSYMLLTGKRYLEKKQLSDVRIMDWMLSLIMLIFGLIFIVFGVILLLKSQNFGIVFFVFGTVSLFFVAKDYANFKGKSKVKNYWLVTHIQRMTGSYIASVTAFLVLNNTFLPDVFAWLLPSVLIVPLIVIWSKKNEVRMK